MKAVWVVNEHTEYITTGALTFDLSMIPSRQSKYVASLIGSLGFSISGRVAYNSNKYTDVGKANAIN